MILKLLLVAAVIVIVYVMFFKQKSVVNTKQANKKTNKTEPANELVQCPTCEVYIEIEEAILSGSSYYCSSECINKAS
jgi:uncharacterized protein